jgi:uncharacterized membrane protein
VAKAKGKAAAPAPAPAARPMQNLRLYLAVLAGLGLAVSIYLTLVHYADVPLVCLEGTSGCEEVNRSIYSQVLGVPVALLGGLSYLAMLAALWAESQQIIKPEEGALALFGLSLAGVLYSLYLTYVELFVLGAVCSWCVVSAVAITAIFALSAVWLKSVIDAEARPAKGKAR